MGAFSERLRQLREDRGLTQQVVADALDVRRPTLAQWEAGRFPPALVKVKTLDEYYGANGELVAAAQAERDGTPVPPADRPITLDAVFDAAAYRLIRGIASDPDNPERAGWAHNLDRPKKPIPTPFSTAAGIMTLLLLDRADVDYAALARTVANRQRQGGWSNRELEVPRPEVSAVALDALTRVGSWGADLAAGWAWLESSIDGPDRDRPYVLSTVLNVAARIRPGTPFMRQLVDDLLSARRVFGGVPLWSADAAVDARRLQPSLAHTARAIVALRHARDSIDHPELDDALTGATDWIIGWARGDDGVTEVLQVDPDNRALDVPVYHFTAAWVLRVLIGAEAVPPARIQSAFRTFWESYSPEERLWIWRLDGRLPVWMTHDAVQTLRLAALAGYSTPITSLGAPRDPSPGTGS